MQTLRFLHVVFMVLWLGTAASEILLEALLWRARTPSRQKAYIELHRTVDLVLEGPALVLTLVTGVALLWQGGYFVENHAWPRWLEDKILAGALVMAANLVCIGFVLLRARAADQLLGQGSPLEHGSVRRWHLAVTSTFLAAPLALVALWLAVNRPS